MKVLACLVILVILSSTQLAAQQINAPRADADPCANCHKDADCVEAIDGFKCQCKRGYEGDGTVCVDIDECSLPTTKCHEKAVCINYPGSFQCECIDGYEGDGIICNAMKSGTFSAESTDKKSAGPIDPGLFLILRGGDITIDQTQAKQYVDPGWQVYKQGELVEAEISYELPEPLNAGEVGTYEITYYAKDMEGHNAQPQKRIVHVTDIDECALKIHKCSQQADCINTIGSYECKCKDGFEGDGFKCADIDECARGTHKCHLHATCSNTIGSYTCRCNPGFEGDGFTCTDIDECATGKNTCDRQGGICINTEGSYQCACKEGYTGDGYSCRLLDSCVQGTHTCHPKATCVKSNEEPEGYKCICNPGYAGDGRTCEDIDECTAVPRAYHCPWHSHCVNTEGTYVCECDDGFEASAQSTSHLVCVDINECQRETHDCDVNANCTNTEGGYYCTCLQDYVGDGRNCQPVSSLAGITLRGANPKVIQQCEPYEEEGFTVNDNKKEKLRVSVSIPPELTPEVVQAVGNFTVKYNVLDDTNQRHVVSRSVIVERVNPCVLPESHVCRHKCHPYATCEFDPLSPRSYRCDCPPDFFEKVTNEEGEIVCRDNRPPIIELLGENPVVLRACKVCSWTDTGEQYSEDVHGGVRAYDEWPNGKQIILTPKVQIRVENVNENTWHIFYDVNDTAGNRAVTKVREVRKEIDDVHHDLEVIRAVMREKFGELEPRTEWIARIAEIFWLGLQILAVLIGLLVLWYFVPRLLLLIRVATKENPELQEYLDGYDFWYSLTRPTWSATKRQRMIHSHYQKKFHDD